MEYYYACAAVLVLFWADEIDTRRGRRFLTLLFGLLGIVYVVWTATRDLKVLNNHIMSGFFTVYLGQEAALDLGAAPAGAPRPQPRGGQ